MSKIFNPEMLVIARELRGLNQSALAELSNIDQGLISRYEGGIRNISDNDLETVSEVLDFPPNFFFREGRRRGTAAAEYFHRKRQALPKNELDKLYSTLDLIRLNMIRLLEVADVESPFSIPQYDPDYYEIEEIAGLVRAKWNVPTGPIPNLTRLLESAFCLIHPMNFRTHLIDEVAQWADLNEQMTPIILINNSISGDRYRFTLAHVLGHFVMHQDKDPYKEMEKEADQFAAAFLMPANDIRQDLEPVTLEHLIKLKPYWKVSISSLVIRAYTLGLIDDSRYKSLQVMMSQKGFKREEPIKLPLEQPSLFKDLISLYRGNFGYSNEELADLLNMYEDDFLDLYLPDEPRSRLKIVSKVNNEKIRKIK